MQYSVVLDAVNEPGFEGYFYAHIPALDLTTQGKGIEGAVAAAKDLAELWVAGNKHAASGLTLEEFRNL